LREKKGLGRTSGGIEIYGEGGKKLSVLHKNSEVGGWLAFVVEGGSVKETWGWSTSRKTGGLGIIFQMAFSTAVGVKGKTFMSNRKKGV